MKTELQPAHGEPPALVVIDPIDHRMAVYDDMDRAIALCDNLPDVKDIRDRAKALAEYLREANDKTQQQRVDRIRLRAERKAGQLLRERDMAKASPGNQHTGKLDRSTSTTGPTLAEIGISKDQSSVFQKLADIPEPEFEDALATDDHISTASVIRGHFPKHEFVPEPAPETFPASAEHRRALKLWGIFMDLADKDSKQLDPRELVELMTPKMIDDMRRWVADVRPWFDSIERTFSDANK